MSLQEETYEDAPEQRSRDQSFNLLNNLSLILFQCMRAFVGSDRYIDSVFAPRFYNDSQSRMGSKALKIDENDNIYLDDAIVAKATKGPLELIFEKQADSGLYNGQDLEITGIRSSIDYLHWNGPNELVDNLRFLVAPSQIGNTGHVNEINAIIEELEGAKLVNRLLPAFPF